MIGSALGAQVAKKYCRKPQRALMTADLSFVLVSVTGCLVSWACIGWRSASLLWIMEFALIPTLLFACAWIVGYQFTAAASLTPGSKSEVVGRLYLSDLAGAACGTILTGLFLIPKIGIMGVLITVAAVKTVSFLMNVIHAYTS
jgi:hypothetical protein